MLGTVGALWTWMFSVHSCGFPGEICCLGDTLHPTVSHGKHPVSLTSVWQDALVGRVGQSENDHQPEPLEHNPLPMITIMQPPLFSLPHGSHSNHSFHLQDLQAQINTTFLQLWGCALPSEGASQSPSHSSLGEEKAIIPSLPAWHGGGSVTTFSTTLSKEILSLSPLPSQPFYTLKVCAE